MSYEPTLIVSYEDLVRADKELGHPLTMPPQEWNREVDQERVLDELYQVMKQEPIEFLGIKFYVFQPEFTSFNAAVREWLDDHDVEYTIHY